MTLTAEDVSFRTEEMGMLDRIEILKVFLAERKPAQFLFDCEIACLSLAEEATDGHDWGFLAQLFEELGKIHCMNL